jgi:hypothetical protein
MTEKRVNKSVSRSDDDSCCDFGVPRHARSTESLAVEKLQGKMTMFLLLFETNTHYKSLSLSIYNMYE